MLESLRQHGQTPYGRFFTAFLFGLLGLAFFITFGPSGRMFNPVQGGPNEFAAKVNGEQISRIEFERRYHQQAQRFGQLDPSMIARLLPRSDLLNSMIRDRLLAEEAQREGIEVSDRELRDDVLKTPSFQEDGKFSNERYAQVVQEYLGQSVEQYEEDRRRDLRSQKLAALLAETAKVSDADLQRQFNEENEKVDLRFVRFSPAFYQSGVTVTDAEVQALLKDKTAEVQAAYQKQAALYHSQKQVRARHILIKVPAGAPATPVDVDATIKDRLAKMKADLEKGGDFAALAKTQSQAADADQGGDLGEIRQGSHLFDPAIETAALNLAEGQVSEPIRTKQGWEIVKADKVIPAQDHPFDEVKAQVARDLLVKQRAAAKAEEAAKAAQAAVQAGKSLATLFPPSDKPASDRLAAPVADHPVSDTTDPFARSATGYVPKIGPAADLQKAAFDASAGKLLAGPTKVGETFVVAEVVTHEKADPSQFAKQKDDLREAALRRMENELVQSLAQKLRSAAVVEINGAVIGPASQQG